MEKENQISVSLAGGNRVTITSTDVEWPLSNPVYAINWFDTKSLPLYNLYNLLASRSVRAVGGRPHFKGKVTQVLHGHEDDRRDVLLIVHYPTAQRFLDLLTSPYFMIVSMLRMVAVKRFTFGFTRSRVAKNTQHQRHQDQAYLLHHFRGTDVIDEMLGLSKKAGARVLYAGTLSARVRTGPANNVGQDLLCLMDGIIVIQAADKGVFDEMISSDGYQSAIHRSTSSFIAHIERLL